MLRIKVNLKGNFTQKFYLAIPDVLVKKKHKHTIQFTQGTSSFDWFKSPKTVFWHPQPCLWQHLLVISRNSCKKIIKIPHLLNNHKCIPMTTSYLKRPSVRPSQHVLTLVVKYMFWSSLCNKFKHTHTHTKCQNQQRDHMAWKLL